MKFQVRLTRRDVIRADLEIEASSSAEADEIVLKMIKDGFEPDESTFDVKHGHWNRSVFPRDEQ